MTHSEGTVITVLRGACEVVSGERLTRLRLSGANAHRETADHEATTSMTEKVTRYWVSETAKVK